MNGLNPEILSVIREASKDEAAYQNILDTINELQEHEFVDYRTLFDNLPDVVFYLGVDYRIKAVNKLVRQNAVQIWDRVPQVGESMLDYTTPANVPLFKQHFSQTLAGETITFERAVPLRDGGVIHYSFSYIPVHDRNGTITGVYFKATDISAYKQTEAALKTSQERNQAFLDAIPDMIFIQDKNGVYVDYHSPNPGHLFIAPEHFLGKKMDAVMPPNLTEKIMPAIQHVLETGEVQIVEYESINTDDPGYFEARLAPCGSEQVLAMIRNITERRKTEARLQDSEIRFRAIFEGASMGIALTDAEGRIVSSNPALMRLTGYSKETIQQLSLYELIHPVDRRAHQQLYNQIVNDEVLTYQIEQRAICKTGEVIWLQMNVSRFPSLESQEKLMIVMAENITPRKITLNALRETEERFYKAFHTNPAAISITRVEDGLYLDVNEAFLTTLGYDRDEVINHTSYELGIWARPDERQKMIDRLEMGEQVTIETQFYKKSGEPCDVFISVETVELNHEVYVLGMFLDITERKQNEARLRESEQRLDLALKGGELALWDWDIETDDLVVNERWLQMIGYEWGEIELKNSFWMKQVHPDDLEKSMKVVRQHWNGQLPTYHAEYRLRNKEGQWRWITARGKVVEWTAEGKPRRMVGTQLDVTEQKEAEAALKESEERFRQIAENIHEVFYIRDPKANRLLYISPAYEAIWGRKIEDILVVSRDYLRAVHPDDLPGVIEALRAEERGGPLFNEEYRIIRPDGSIRYIWARNTALRDEQGEIYRIIGLAEDITDRKLAQKQMLDMAIERERVDILSDFISDASHEFRTPLSIINTKLYLLERTEDLERRKGYMQSIREQIDNIVTLLESLVLMSQLDIEDQSFMNVNMDEVLHLLGNEMAEVAENRNIHVLYEVNTPTPPVFGNFENIYQALSNIFENALRYTRPGGQIIIRKFMEDGAVVVEIEDNGIGIREDELPQIFKSFFRGDAAHTTRGFGLGLPIAQRIIESHHGTIEVRSQVGEGSLFRVSLSGKPT